MYYTIHESVQARKFSGLVYAALSVNPTVQIKHNARPAVEHDWTCSARLRLFDVTGHHSVVQLCHT